MYRRGRLTLFADLTALTGVGLLISGLVAIPSAASGGSVLDGSDWGSQGTLNSDSAVTVRWDNAGNSDANTVERNSLQTLPHTLNKTYANIAKTVRESYASTYGSDNSAGGLTVTVSQTENLVNQTITVNATGASGPLIGGTVMANYLQIFQCWGSQDEAAPDPAHCEFGGPGPDVVGAADQVADGRMIGSESLLDRGDWEQYKGAGSGEQAPFVAVDGTSYQGIPRGNPFFSSTTTNEWAHANFDANGTLTRQVEVQTGAESSGLGCGQRSDAASTATCWLVIVPRVQSLASTMSAGPLSPQVWGQRLQVRLSFRPVFTTCPNGQASLLIAGSEALKAAAASWTPGVCEDKQLTFGYTATGDEIARNQYAAGSSTAILTSKPITRAPAGAQTAAVPLTLTAPVIAYNFAYRPECIGDGKLTLAEVAALDGADGEDAATACGYASLAAAKADYARTGHPVTDLRLNARLVVKLLTQTYRVSLHNSAQIALAPLTAYYDLFGDPEFRSLNPQLSHMPARSGSQTSYVGRALVEGLRSDESAALWAWALQDTGAASFLAGCPDPQGKTINPFYSTRTYTGCEYIKTRLEKQAAALRKAVDVPSTYVDEPLSYPPAGSPYSQPNYYEEPGTVKGYPLSFADSAAPFDSASVVARQTAWYEYPGVEWCSYAQTQDDSCAPVGRYKKVNTRARAGYQQVFGVTDSGSAAKYQLSTAKLCDEDGSDCVGADSQSLQKAADKMVTDKASGTLQLPSDVSGFYAAGAYPLTMPVYAVVNLTSSTASERAGFAGAFASILGSGQIPGFSAGSLAPGFAPLTDKLRALAKAGIAAITSGPSATASPSPSDSSSASSSSNPTVSRSEAAATVPKPPVESPAPSATVVAAAPAGSRTVTSAGSQWPSTAVPVGLGLAMAGGVAGPIMRSRRRLKVGR